MANALSLSFGKAESWDAAVVKKYVRIIAGLNKQSQGGDTGVVPGSGSSHHY